MVLGIDPKVDYAFKWLFGKEQNASILIHLLHAVLNPAPEEQIVEIQILNPFNDKLALDERLSVLDIKVRDHLGRQFNVEMQTSTRANLSERILYYWGKLYTEQLQVGEDYRLLKPTISICFVDGILFPAVPEHHLSFRLIDALRGVSLTHHLGIHFLELPKFRRTPEELATPLDAWLYFLKNGESLSPESLTGSLGTPEIRRAMEALAMLTQIDMEKEIYEGRLKARRDELMRLTDMKEWEEALKEREGAIEEREGAIEEREGAIKEAEARILVTKEGLLAEGRARGILIGRIEFAQRLLRRDAPTRADLEAMPLEALEQLAVQLEQELIG
jgi:predicted transposase/invertase (TIGR01784 family)